MSIEVRSEELSYIDYCGNGLQCLSPGAKLALGNFGDSPEWDPRTASWPHLCGERIVGFMAAVSAGERVSLEQILEWEDGVNHANHDDDTHRVKDMIDVASRGKLRARAYAGGSNFDAYRKVIDKGNLLLAGVIEAGTDSIKGGNIRGMDAYEHFLAGVGYDRKKVLVACSSWRELQNRPDVGFFSLDWDRFLKIWRWSDSGISPKDGVNRLEVDGWTEHLGLVVSRV